MNDILIETMGGMFSPDMKHDLAWEHCNSLVDKGAFDIGSDDFTETYQYFVNEYDECLQHSGFLQFISLRVLKELFRTKHIALTVTEDDNTEEIIKYLTELSSIITSSLMYTVIAYETEWVENYIWNQTAKEHRSVLFPFGKGVKENDNDN